ncbi:MAG: glycosyltransferase, partial [Prevotellaceae bacterium]|nr:glycosyltransferase [Prevotellaceae bacterium]
IGASDIFFDLRQIDAENTRCLPIKLFYYMAAGRPVVYSDLKAIRKEVPEWEQIGTLVNPNHTDKTAATIAQWINNKETYQQQCAAALRCAQTKYNWENIAPKFVKLVAGASS